MAIAACAQKSSAPCCTDNSVFPGSFYKPYALAVQTVFLLACSLRDNARESGEDCGVLALTFRLKSPASIGEKLRRKHLPVSPASARSALHDIAGLRVVLGDEAQVYRFAQRLCASPAMQLCVMRDYIQSPKVSGYRSLHLIVQVSVPVADGRMSVPVEIQLRTQAMDIWASIEHDIIYKPKACAAHA